MTFTDTTHGWIWNYFNLYQTSNGGRTWQAENGISRIESVFPGGLFMINKDLGWAVGSDGWIFRYDSGNITSLHNSTIAFLDDWKLMQNFPNPFNPSTTIRFSLDAPQAVTLTIYDITGREVIRLLDEKTYFSGEHSVLWTGTNESGKEASSGIYFYRLKVGISSQTKKMILLR
jgi:hypothetical protein